LSFLATNEELLLVHRDMPYVTRAKRYDLMLTPQFYIFKKESLPISYHYQAMKLAPSILDELTGAGAYSYAVIQEDDGWAFIAYDMGKIETFLVEKGLSKNLINKIYFAQQAKEHFKYPVSADEKNAIVTVDDTVVILPKSIVAEEEYGIVTNAFRPDKGVSPAQSGNTLVTQKQAIILSLLLIVLAAGYFVQGIKYQNAMTQIEVNIEKAKAKSPEIKGKSNFLLKNLYESNYALDSTQRKIRDRLKDLSKLTSKVSKIDTLKITPQGYDVSIATNQKSIPKLKKYAKSKKLKVVKSTTGFMLKGAL